MKRESFDRYRKAAAGNPMIFGYLKKYQEDPSSRVFAPLAEAYRKAGLADEAIEIAREGLQLHPGFVGGRVALARALFDKSKFSEVVEELQNLVQDVPDNLVAQRLLAESSLMLGNVAEALGAYKMLLFFTPTDTETARIVAELEAQAYEKGSLVLRNDALRNDPHDDGQEEDAMAGYSVQSVVGAIAGDPGLKRGAWIKKVERLQVLLQRVERYRSLQ
jgi:predicted Zn-dependent protease